MLLSVENGSLRQLIGEKETIELYARVGFDALDYSFSPWLEYGEMPWNGSQYKAYAQEVNQMMVDNNLVFNQAHGPFVFDGREYLEQSEQRTYPLFDRCFECCALLDIPHIVIHPIHHVPYAENKDMLWEINVLFYQRMFELSKQYGVKVALENMYQNNESSNDCSPSMFATHQEYTRFYDALDQDAFICLIDTGHCSIVGEDAAAMISSMGNRVVALHVNDNLCVTDDHIVPGHGKIVFEEVYKSLAAINYAGDITFEVLNLYRNVDSSLYETQAKYLHDVGRYIIDRIKYYQTEAGRHG